MRKLYIVTFEIHRDCQIRDFVYYCMAENAKEAVSIARANWTGDGHQFHIHAVKSRIQDLEKISVRTWKNTVIPGENVIGRYIMLDFHTWRWKDSSGHYRYAHY